MLEPKERPTYPQAGCPHHWIIESPNGPTSHGHCVLCGAEREFPNWSTKQRVMSAAEKAAVSRARREEAAVTGLIREFGRNDFLPLSRYRRNLRDPDDGE